MLTLIAAVALVAADVAAPAAAVDPAVPAASTAESEKVICKRVNATGSRIRAGKTCMTRAEWAQRTKDDQKSLTDMQNKVSKTN